MACRAQSVSSRTGSRRVHAAVYRKRDVAHAELRGERLDVVLAVALHIRQVLRRRRQRWQRALQRTKRPRRHTFVMAMTVANMVTKHVMKVIAGLHCTGDSEEVQGGSG